MIKPEEVKAIQKYIIWVRFSDGVEGEVDLSYLSGKGVFKYWDKNDNFKKVKISKKFRSLLWNDDIDISADNIYMKITGKTPGQLFSAHHKEKSNA